MTAPDWATPDVLEKLRFLKDFSFQTTFGVYEQQEKSRLQGGILLGEIVKNLTEMAVPDPKRRLKMMMLSASSMNVFNGRQPPYASCQMFELYRDDNGITKSSISLDRDKECQLPSAGRDKEVIISLAVSGCLLLGLIVVLLAVICWQKEPVGSRGYHQVINGEES
ncbi:Lysosomal acid phosphatase [Liparis tanakae]|uniref:Lysosomal acid phosphatase n=1 Tax=Liparis tanakae TaxID=230148 RepID=A0A4Z2G5L0_9TELE|nr:Lysosomal acid phosphatase [Liparis tanakae]